ncbi:MAG: DNA-binding transcriptional regulator OxyR [Gammaproteobacteria bacterium]|nr:DNA-binding transcriptional regulator OxyR [Gammaproteobacteria bacterium]
MNLRELEYLVAVDEERHFHRAAQRCFVSQPTLSGQLKKLEQELGVLLVERSNRQVNMTDVGKAVADQARRVLGEARLIGEIVGSFDDPMAGELHLGLIPTVAPYLLPWFMKPLAEHYPRLKLWLYEYQTHVLLQKLRRAELDVLILALPVDTEEFAQLELYSEPFLLAVPVTEQLASHELISLTDLNGKEVLLLEEGHCLRGQALDICFSAGAHETRGFHASSLETLRHMVGEGMGMTLMPGLAVPEIRRKGDTVLYLRFSDPQPQRRIGMVYRRGSYREPAFSRIAEIIREKVLPIT